ncbi:hypothetical protein HRG_013098 [Hirsutella rhossiliensis]
MPHRGSQGGVVSIVCIRCGEEKPAQDFLGRRKSAGHTKSCLGCRNKRAYHYSRSRRITQTLREVAVRPSSADGPAAKRTDRDARLQPEQKIPKAQPTSSESFQERHTVRFSSEDSMSQPRVVLGTPLPPTQQSSGKV